MSTDSTDTVYVGTYKSECFHEQGCPRLSADRPQEMTLEEAKSEGYSRCPDFGEEREIEFGDDANFNSTTIRKLQELGYAEDWDNV